MEGLLAHGNGPQIEQRTEDKTSHSQLSLLGPEGCRICDSPLDAKADLSSGECVNRSRRSLEVRHHLHADSPGVVARFQNIALRCGRLFLDMEKLMKHRPITGIPDVALALLRANSRYLSILPLRQIRTALEIGMPI